MQKKSTKWMIALLTLLILALTAGCGGSGAHRPSGLAPDAVVKNFFDAAKANKMNEASLYVSPDSVSDTKVIVKYVTGQSEISELKNANLLSVEKVAERGDYAVVLATLQQTNSVKLSWKPVGLTRINNEWYIVDKDTIFQDAKYKILQELLAKI
ncbi:MAG: hypothetical protein N2491_05065 [Negativicutes bacterium]|nr:hypothetical protein [Negativicutes bacterium]